MKKPTQIQFYAQAVIFIAAIALIVQLFPRHGSFRYDYNVGQPWGYDLLTAPYDFAILKDEEQLQAEQTKALQNFAPYYRLDLNTANTQINALKDFLNSTPTATEPYSTYLTAAITEVYNIGIAGSLDIDTMTAAGYTQVHVLPLGSSSAITKNLSELFTIRSAYQHIVASCPANLNKQQLEKLNINYFLTENLSYDSLLSNRDHAELLRSVSTTTGMVKAGSHIIDRGEIVTTRTYRILNSLKYSYSHASLLPAASEAVKVTLFGKQFTLLSHTSFTLIGDIIAVTILLLLLFLYLYLFRPSIFAHTRNVVFILIMVLIPIVLASLTLRFTKFYIYIVPFALVPVIVRTFFDARTALFAHIITSLIASLIANSSFEFALLQITAGMTAVSSLKDMTTRGQLAMTAFYVFLCYTGIYVSYCLMVEGDITTVNPYYILAFALSSILLLFSYGFIFIFETIFGYTSAVTLMELTNTSRPLLQQLSDNAPGTFQHSLMVSNLISPAAKAINADILSARVGALYHDIGKLQHPEFFTENQAGGVNPLSQLDYEDAASRIINHVSDGVIMARSARLPHLIIDFIRTHHGNSHTQYFYNSYINEHNGQLPPQGAFSYQGPLPQTREQVLLMMADSIEAASRSILGSESNDLGAKLDALVDSIIDQQMNQGLYKQSPISFRDIETVRQVFKNKLRDIYHTRIAYPSITSHAKK